MQGIGNVNMKITSINRKNSNEYSLELNTEPKLEQAVFDHFQLLAAQDHKLRSYAFSKLENSGLILHTRALIDSVNSKGLASLIEDIFSKAESIAALESAATKHEDKLRDDRTDAIIEAAANKLGIPIM